MNADAMYTVKKDVIRRKLAEIESRIKAHEKNQADEPFNWEYVGDLSEVDRQLSEILLFLGE